MRLKHYINESEDIPWEQIKKDCQPFIKEIKNPNCFLYSGRKEKLPYIKKKVRKDRKPLDTPEVIHNALNDIFKKKFGIKLRSESLFVSKCIGQASGYGTPYIILPIGKYKLYSNTDITDLYSSLNQYVNLTELVEFWTTEYIKPAKEDFMNRAQKIVDGYKETTSPVKQRDKQEIMLVCDEYYAINAEKTLVQELLIKLYKD